MRPLLLAFLLGLDGQEGIFGGQNFLGCCWGSVALALEMTIIRAFSFMGGAIFPP